MWLYFDNGQGNKKDLIAGTYEFKVENYEVFQVDVNQKQEK